MSDASIVAVGAMLAQIWDGYEHPVSYFSKALTEAQQKWHPFELETYGCLMALRAFRHYIAACQFVIVTDCRALAHFNTTREVSAKIVRWLAEISQYGAEFIHRKGELNVIPDLQSRDCGYTNHLSMKEMRHHMKHGAHSTPLKLHSQIEGVGRPWNKSTDQKRDNKKIIRKIKLMTNNISMSKVAEEQRSNRFCRQIVDFYTKGKLPEDKKGEMAFLQKIQEFTVRNGVVYKTPSPSECHPPLPYVSDTDTRKYLLTKYHDDAEAAHPGEHKMRMRILKSFWWPTLAVDIKEYCNNCKSCHKAKVQIKAKPPLQPIKHEGAWEFVSMDHMGKLPRTSRGYTHALVIIDRFTRWVEIVPIKGDKEDKGLSSTNTLRKFRKRVVDRHGLPKKVLTDGSKSFQGKLEEYLKENKVKIKVGDAYKHDTNGMAERMIRTIKEKLRHYVNQGLNDWDKYLSIIQSSINSHEAWGPKASPFFLNHGRERRTEAQGQLLTGLKTTPPTDQHIEWAYQKEAEQQLQLEEAHQENVKSQERMKNKRGQTPWIPQKDDLVMVSRPPETVNSTLEPLTDGPFKVIEKDKHGNCTLGAVGSDAHKLQTVSMKRLSKFRGTLPDGRGVIPSESIDLKALIELKKQKVTKIVTELQQHLKTGCTVTPQQMKGLKIEVKWNQPGALGWWSGTVVDYNPVNHTFLVKYDVPSADQEDTYPERLLHPTMPEWRILTQRGIHPQKGGVV